jgi:hypothetical protein
MIRFNIIIHVPQVMLPSWWHAGVLCICCILCSSGRCLVVPNLNSIIKCEQSDQAVGCVLEPSHGEAGDHQEHCLLVVRCTLR